MLEGIQEYTLRKSVGEYRGDIGNRGSKTKCIDRKFMSIRVWKASIKLRHSQWGSQKLLLDSEVLLTCAHLYFES